MRVDWAAVPYYAETTTVSFGIEIDDTSQIFSIDLLGGIVANPGSTSSGDSQWLGLSVGGAGGATDPGLTLFSPGGGGPAIPNATDMLYDYYDYLTGVGGIAGSLSSATRPRPESSWP